MSDNYASDTTRVFTDSDLFFDQLTVDVQSAKKSVFIQCMSFEADSVGTKLIELLGSKPTLERILLIDHYSQYVVNDTFLNSPRGWMNKNNARSERKALDILIARAIEMGIRVKFTSPMGFMMRRYPMRNHKKVILIDDHVSYLGGMNFTEHNFRWADLMIRHFDEDINAALQHSFECDYNETDPKPETEISEEKTLYILNGLKTKEAYRKLLEFIKGSKKVVVVSPYISYPFLDAIAQVENNTVLLPKNNNKSIFNFIHSLKRYSPINFKYVDGEMLHTKLMILDDKTAIYGSSNFDTVSYLFEKELLLMNNNTELLSHLNNIIEELLN